MYGYTLHSNHMIENGITLQIEMHSVIGFEMQVVKADEKSYTDLEEEADAKGNIAMTLDQFVLEQMNEKQDSGQGDM